MNLNGNIIRLQKDANTNVARFIKINPEEGNASLKLQILNDGFQFDGGASTGQFIGGLLFWDNDAIASNIMTMEIYEDE